MRVLLPRVSKQRICHSVKANVRVWVDAVEKSRKSNDAKNLASRVEIQPTTAATGTEVSFYHPSDHIRRSALAVRKNDTMKLTHIALEAAYRTDADLLEASPAPTGQPPAADALALA
jgi:hypothetical protein